MSRRYLGKTFDIHGGGQDLIFPHHENEIAQSECCNGVTFARYWMHNGFINVDGEKMAKSKGNFFTVRDVANLYGYEPIRYLLISCHYRSPINYSYDIVEQCKASLQRLYNCREGLDFAAKNAVDGDISADVAKMLETRKNEFCNAMDDDLNTADALGVLFELVRDINKFVLTDNPVKANVKVATKLFDELATDVLGLVYNRKLESLDDEVEALIAARTEARKNKNWAEADRIRDLLKEMGIILEDTAQGIKWHRA
jgi:cysteinyl-tRNA synthetase